MYKYSEKDRDKRNQKKLFLAGLLGLLPFLYYAIVGYADWTSITAMDYKIGAFFYDLRNPLFTSLVALVTDFGDKMTIVAVTFILVLILFTLQKWQVGLWLGLSVALGSGVLNAVVKNIYQRPRPDQIEHLVEQGGYSFPSGHSMGAIVLYGGILFILIRMVKSNQVKWLLGIIMGSLVLVVGLSRIYLGVHYPSDVIAGVSLGFSWLCFTTAIFGLNATRQELQGQNSYSFKNN